ncbi:hypothetical protein [Nocardia bovistercoris]|uniref:Uncharacterized protein n=1 Tax=Nocardia bovistercoris TaxID=2785916 RepID=A0A931IEZ4_9NOCA|nr:hypothetical protein [Nocardia bovistercoris]MBH0779323.1 hypothetical protein [Nocardia bovistercoris]
MLATPSAASREPVSDTSRNHRPRADTAFPPDRRFSAGRAAVIEFCDKSALADEIGIRAAKSTSPIRQYSSARRNHFGYVQWAVRVVNEGTTAA